ncbi:hypothetical protein CU044_3042 [Streptomyces sp. L-9-10]|uniref:hypothetical protein n=1 Tax=unclassified Streptomyces TaxID=2593676 RepID=UPI00101C7268|nr:hypothetical protein [Streptomyces sp. L-9-10]RYJ27861.1 hypothetical protein CU044_3042 [Streptomyces sp. L-9-10]
MVWEEWENLKGEVSGESSARMRLNQLPGDPGPTGGGSGGGAADLSVNRDSLGRIGSAAYDLHGRLTADGGHARTSTSGAAAALSVSGFETGPAMRKVHDTWNSQLKTLVDACAHISNHLDYSAAQHAKDDQDIRTSLGVSRISEYFK